jgi:Arc/MetJ-type ribon-helix-helix transcriptional regulator
MLEFFLWVILIYFALMLIWRYVIPFFLRRAVKKMEKQYRDQMSQHEAQQRRGREGEVNIHSMPEDEEVDRRPPADLEYTDFEEITDDQSDKKP